MSHTNSAPSNEKDYIIIVQKKLCRAFLDIIAEKHPTIATLLQKKIAIEEINCPYERIKLYKKLWQDLQLYSGTSDIQKLFLDYEVKLQDLGRRARKIATSHIAQDADRGKRQTADHFDYVFRKFKEHRISSHTVQHYLDHHAMAWFSITAHPTNPCSVAYTHLGNHIDAILDSNHATARKLIKYLRLIRDTPITSLINKTPIDELHEVLPTLEVIYNASIDVRNNLIQSMQKYGYDNNTLPLSLIRPNLWILGDCDGNHNQNADNLLEGITLLRQQITLLYEQDLQAILRKVNTEPTLYHCKKYVQRIIDDLRQIRNPLTRLKSLQRDLDNLANDLSLHKPIQKRINNLRFKTSIFGMHFARIDIRHNAKDLMQTIARVAKKAGIIMDEHKFHLSPIGQVAYHFDCHGILKTAQTLYTIEEQYNDNAYTDESKLITKIKSLRDNSNLNSINLAPLEQLIECIQENGLDFEKNNQEEQLKYLSEWLSNPAIIAKLQNVDSNKLCISCDDNIGMNAKRTLSRLGIIGKNPDMAAKFIIAENKGAHHVLAALLLLKITGNIISKKGALIDLVTLSESVPDLLALKRTQLAMLANPQYREHVRIRGRLIAQIAKSDTVRRHGRGAEESQDFAVESLFSIEHDIKQKYPELSHVRISAFQGGGAALQRGGGKISEMAHKHGNAAIEAGAKSMFGPSTLTIQGHHKSILLHPRLTANLFLGSLIAQGIYAAAKVDRKIPQRSAPNFVDYNIARYLHKKSYALMRQTYPAIIHNPAIDELFTNGPWVSIKLGNRSSRASTRKSNKAEGHTPQMIAPFSERSILRQRAIGSERLAAHSGTQILSLISLLAGMEYLEKLDHADTRCFVGGALHYVYKGNKAQRDAQRNTAITLAMTNYHLAWDMMIDQPRPHEISKIYGLAKEFEVFYQFSTLVGPCKEHIKKLGKDAQQYKNKCTLSWLEIEALKIARLNFISISGQMIDDIHHLMAEDVFCNHTPLMNGWSELSKSLLFRERKLEFCHYIESILTKKLNLNSAQDLPLRDKELLLLAYAGADYTNAPLGAAMTRTSQQSDHISSNCYQPKLFRRNTFKALNEHIKQLEKKY